MSFIRLSVRPSQKREEGGKGAGGEGAGGGEAYPLFTPSMYVLEP